MGIKTKFDLKDSVEEIGGNKIGIIEAISIPDKPGEEIAYSVEFDGDFSTRRFIKESNLKLRPKAKVPQDEIALVPDRPLMD
ncbi:MAG: hypothetical protein ABSF46_23160 [Terriglobia bacterium]|jgi:hypothetical protein